MSYSVETINNCTKKLIFNFESVDLSKEITQALKEKQKSSNLKGFRKGKAPLSVVSKLYSGQAENDALYRFVSKEFFNALEKEEIRAVGYPKFGQTKYEAEKKSVEFEATVEIYPEFEIEDYSNYSFKKESDKVENSEVEKIKTQYLESKSELIEVEGPAQVGHLCVFDFEGEKEDGEKPASMKGENYTLELGSKQFIPGFEEGLIGLKKGDEKTLKLSFPQEYHVEELKGVPVKFHVKIHDIKEKKYPELTDELAKEFGFEDKKDFETKIAKNLQTQKTRQTQEQLHQEILEKLIEKNKFDVPSAMVAEQRVHLEKEMSQNLKAQGFNDGMVQQYFQKWGEELNNKAQFQVKSGLILSKLAEKYNVSLEDSDWDNKFSQMAEQSGMELEQVKKIYGENENIKKNLSYAIREEKTFACLIDDMKIE